VEKQSRHTTRLPTSKRSSVLRLVGALLLLVVLKISIHDTVVSKRLTCSCWSDRPRFPFPRRHLTVKQREELFLYVLMLCFIPKKR
jgi:hypothetical protein